MRRLYNLLNASLLGYATWLVASKYAGLPARIPVHFGFDGTPDRWGAKSEIFILVGVMWGITALFYALSLAMPRISRNPQYLNIPNKQQFLKLPPERQAIFFGMLQDFMTAMTVAFNLIFLLVIRATLRVIERKAAGVPFQEVGWGLAAIILVMVIYFPRLFTLPKKLIRGDEF